MQQQGPFRSLFDSIAPLFHQRPKAPLPSTLRALEGDVKIFTDTYGVPHIYAQSRADLFFAQGYVVARDRLFQIDYTRHAARGRICELVGNKPLPWKKLTVHFKERTTLDVDFLLRTFGLEQAAKLSWEIHSPEARQIITAFTAGINAYLEHQPRSLEHKILGVSPKPWQETDCLVVLKAIAFELSNAWRAILYGGMLQGAGLDKESIRLLGPHLPQDTQPIVDAAHWGEVANALAATREATAAVLTHGDAPGVGSNSWVVAGEHTQSGRAILANDTHLRMQAPNAWHEIHLHGGDLNLHGFSVPGVPGVGVGRSVDHAWGITAGLVQDLDIFAERVSAGAEDHYDSPEGPLPFSSRQEVFHIAGGKTVDKTILTTRHGPIIDSVSTLPASTLPASPSKGKGQPAYRYAVQWTGQQASQDLDALLGMWTARSLDEFRASGGLLGAPTYNLLYAGDDGTIAYCSAGAIPIRAKDAPLRPLEGWTGEWDWQGRVPYKEQPFVKNPDCGYLVTANTRIAPPEYPYELGQLFEPDHRHQQIVHRLQSLIQSAAQARRKITLAEVAAIQSDRHAPWAVEVRDQLLQLVGGAGGLVSEPQSLQRGAAQLFSCWDGDAGSSSAGAAVVYTTVEFLGEEVIQSLAGSDAARAFLELGTYGSGLQQDLVARREHFQALGIDLPKVIRSSFARATQYCINSMGNTLGDWRWGRIHGLFCPHAFDATPLGGFFSLAPEAAGGGPDTIDRGDFNAAVGFHATIGAALRFVCDVGEGSEAITVIPGGQSGDRFSPFYDDQLSLYLAGEYKQVPWLPNLEVAEGVLAGTWEKFPNGSANDLAKE